MKKVLIACEESQRVCTAFRELGAEAYSADIQECSGGHPEWHIIGDVLPIINGDADFVTMDGCNHYIDKWDLIIAHPPCTDLCNSGARHFERKRKSGEQRASIEFFCKFINANCEHIAVENPMGIISGTYIYFYYPDLCRKYGLPLKYSQVIQPFEYGDAARKATCLWLKNLPCLKPTNVVEPELKTYYRGDGTTYTMSSFMNEGFKAADRSKARSKTFEGIAKAMASQWINAI